LQMPSIGGGVTHSDESYRKEILEAMCARLLAMIVARNFPHIGRDILIGCIESTNCC